jgi:hypothetical protein
MGGVGSSPLCTFADAVLDELTLLLAIVHSPQN